MKKSMLALAGLILWRSVTVAEPSLFVGCYSNVHTTLDMRHDPPKRTVKTTVLDVRADGTCLRQGEPTCRYVGRYQVTGSNTITATFEIQEARMSLMEGKSRFDWVARGQVEDLIQLRPDSQTYRVCARPAKSSSTGMPAWFLNGATNATKCLVLGRVRIPGELDCTGGLPLSTVLARAGGYAVEANRTAISITRGPRIFIINGRSATNTLVSPGDVVYVPENK